MRTWVWLVGFLSLVCSDLQAQVIAPASLTGRWIGVSTEWDIDTYCPLPAVMDLRADSTWQFSLIGGAETPKEGRWALLANDTLQLGEARYAPELVMIRGDLLRIGRIQPMTFRRFRPELMDPASVWRRLAGQVWQSDSVRYCIATDGRIGVQNRRTGVQTVHYAQVVAMDESAFLIVRGSAHGREGNTHSFWQVVSNEVGVIKLLGGSAGQVQTETIRWVRPMGATELVRPSTFQPCLNCFAKVSATVFPSIHAVNRKPAFAVFRTQYQPLDLPGQSGVILLSFVQNCAGERAEPEWQELDADYKRRSFDARMMNQLRTIVRDHLPSTLFASEEPQRDVVVSFTLRFVDGRLTDVF